jgi:putative MFS transporter
MAAIAAVVAACGIAYGLSSGTAGILVFGILVSLFSQSFVAVIYTYTPEAFPTAFRGSGSGLVYGAGRLANVFGPMLIPPIFVAFGYTAVFVAVAACWIGAGLIVAILGPETTGKPLETQAARQG